jgi:flagellar hook-associated protein 2
MSSPVSFSGFNGVDFSLILNSVMTQESAPLVALQASQTAVATRIANFATLATKTNALQTASDAMKSASSLAGFSAASTDSSAVAVSAGSGASAGHYDIVVKELARAQVTASSSFATDPTAAFVTTDGTLAITATGSATPVNVDVTSGMTLSQVADAINAKADAAATASVVQDGAASFRLVLTAKATGDANGFTVADTATGDVKFEITNAVDATDASLTVNNIDIVSASNTLDAAIPGASITLLKKSATTTVGVDIATDPSALKSKVSGFIAAYNDLVNFVARQTTAANSGDDSSIARDPLVRQLRNSLRGVLASSYGAGGTNNLSQVGVEFDRTGGTLSLNSAVFSAAVQNGTASLSSLFSGTTDTPGAFAAVSSLLDSYTQSSGMFSAVTAQLTAQVSNMSNQIDRMQARLALRRASLQAEYTAADQAMTALKNQSSSLTSFTSSLTSTQ